MEITNTVQKLVKYILQIRKIYVIRNVYVATMAVLEENLRFRKSTHYGTMSSYLEQHQKRGPQQPEKDMYHISLT